MNLPQMIRNLWIYRRVLLLAVLLGIVLYFVFTNNKPLEVSFPFIGEISSTSGIVMLASAALGAAACWLVLTFRRALRDAHRERRPVEDPAKPPPGKAPTAEGIAAKGDSERPQTGGS